VVGCVWSYNDFIHKKLKVKIIAHTKYGIFEGVEQDYDEKKYEDIGKFLGQLSDLKNFSFHTDKGEIFFTKEMIADTLFVLEK